MHQLLVRSTMVQFDRLSKTMDKTEEEHTKFRKSMFERAAKAHYPTQGMIDDVESDLNKFRISYLPEDKLQKDKVATVEELDKAVAQTLSHLKDKVIPSLKKMQGSVQKRNIWLQCDDRNKKTNAMFDAENEMIHQLIVSEQQKIHHKKNAALKYPDMMQEKATLRAYEYDSEILHKLKVMQT